MKANTPVPIGYSSYEIPVCLIAQAWIEGEKYDILSNAHQLTVEGINKYGYKVDWQNYFACEVYTDARFGIPKSNGQNILVLDYYIPCIKIK